MAVVSGEFNLAVFSCLSGEPLNFRHGFLWNQGTRLVGKTREGMVGFRESETVTVRGDHGDHIGLQSELSTVQRVTRLLHGNRESGPGDQGRENSCRYRHERMRENWNGREIILGHAHHLVVAPVRGNVHPVVFEQAKANFTFGQQPHQFEQLLRGYRAGALFFNLRLTRSTNAELEVRRRQRDAVAFGFTQKMRKDGDRGFALDDTLREIQRPEQIVLFNGKFHLRFPPR